jgi:hypothetical protein
MDALQEGSAETFAVKHGPKPQLLTIKDVKERVSATLRVFQERGVLAHREYGQEVPAAVHGAPRTVEVRRCTFITMATVRAHRPIMLNKADMHNHCASWLFNYAWNAQLQVRSEDAILSPCRRAERFWRG